MKSNLARTAAGIQNTGAVLVMQILSNPSVIDNLTKQGYRVDWQEVLGLFTEKKIISKN